MKCVVLAAGEGKRMHPLTYTRPKVMLPVANKPFLEWNLLNAKKAGVTDFVFIVAYKSEMVRRYFGDGSDWDVSIEYVNQGKALGTAHAIGTVREFVDDFIVLSGDTIFGVEDIKNIMGKPQSMGLIEVADASQYGSVECDGESVKRIYEKMDRPFSNLINAGIYHFSSSIFKYIDQTGKSVRSEFEITDTINMVAETEDMHSVLLHEWRDVVYPWHLLDANQEMMKNLAFSCEGAISDGANLIGEVFVGNGSQILPGVLIEGPVIIGKDCKIGPNCYIRPATTIGDNCHVGNACEVKNSIIFNNSNVPHQNYVGDSIIGEKCNLGAGTKIANLRFDKKEIRIVTNEQMVATQRKKFGAVLGDGVSTAINATINVGAMIGNDVSIGPGIFIEGEIRPRSKIL